MKPHSFAIFLLSFFLSALSPALADAPPLRVGVILPLTGEVAAIGNAVKNGIIMAHEKLPPEERAGIELYYEDDQFLPKNSVSALTRLMSDKKIDVLLSGGSSTSKALAPIAEGNKITFITLATDPTVSVNRKYVFNIWVSVEAETDALIPELQRRGYKRIARIATIHDMMTAVKNSFDGRGRGGAEIALDEDYSPDVKDFKPFLTKIRADPKIDSIMALLMPGQLGIFAKQARELGLKLPLFGYEMFEDAGEVQVSNGALIGQWYSHAGDPGEEFSKAYAARYPGASSFGTAHIHDAVLLLAAARRKGVSPAELPGYLSTVKDFKGALGTFSSAPENRFTLPAALKVVTKGGFEKLPG